MLKLIYSLSDKEITLKFNKRRLFWTKELLIALMVSVVFHSLILGVFRIKALKPKYERILQPSNVIAEIYPQSSPLAHIRVDDNGFLQSLPKPPTGRVQVESQNEFFEKPLTLELDNRNYEGVGESFSLSEKSDKSEKLPHLDAFKMVLPIQILASDVFENRLISRYSKAKKVAIGTTETLHCKFFVEVEDKRGEIFHSEMLTSTGYPKYDHYAQRLLQEVTFSKIKDQFATCGEIDLLIEVDKRDICD